MLGVDRDSSLLASMFDERDPAVTWAMEMAIRGAHRAGKPIGICGQAPSDRPEIAAQLVRLGIDSVSLNPDSVVMGTLRFLAAEETASALPSTSAREMQPPR
jgi:pyruvate,water dikinase